MGGKSKKKRASGKMSKISAKSSSKVKRKAIDATARSIDDDERVAGEGAAPANDNVPAPVESKVQEGNVSVDTLLQRTKLSRMMLLASRASEARSANNSAAYDACVRLLKEEEGAPPFQEKVAENCNESSSNLAGCIYELEKRIANIHFRDGVHPAKDKTIDVSAFKGAIKSLPPAARQAGVHSLLDAAEKALEQCAAFESRKIPL